MNDPNQLKKTQEIGVKEIVMGGCLLAEKSRWVFGGSSFKLSELDLTAEKPQPAEFPGAGHGSYVTSVACGAGGLVSGGYDCQLIWWNVDDKSQVRQVAAHDKVIRRVVASPDGKQIASVADDMQCKLWEAETGKLVRGFTDHQALTPHHYPSMLYGVTFSADGKLLATADKVGHVAVWETESGKKVGAVEAPLMYTWDPRARVHSIGGARSVAFSPDGQLLAVGGTGKIGNIDHLEAGARVEVFDWKAGKRLHELDDGQCKGLVEQIAFHPSGEWFLTAGGDHKGFVTIYETKTGKLLKQESVGNHIHAVSIDAEWKNIYAVAHERLYFWQFA